MKIIMCDVIFMENKLKKINDLMKIIMCDVPDRISLPSAFIFVSLMSSSLFCGSESGVRLVPPI